MIMGREIGVLNVLAAVHFSSSRAISSRLEAKDCLGRGLVITTKSSLTSHVYSIINTGLSRLVRSPVQRLPISRRLSITNSNHLPNKLIHPTLKPFEYNSRNPFYRVAYRQGNQPSQ